MKFIEFLRMCDIQSSITVIVDVNKLPFEKTMARPRWIESTSFHDLYVDSFGASDFGKLYVRLEEEK